MLRFQENEQNLGKDDGFVSLAKWSLYMPHSGPSKSNICFE